MKMKMCVDVCVLAFRAEVSFLVRRTFMTTFTVISVGYDSSEAVFYGVYYKVQENSYSPNL